MDTDYNKVILRALADIRRGQILATKAAAQTADLYDNAFVHAIMHRIYPIDHEDLGSMGNASDILQSYPFYDTYDVGRDQVREIAGLLDRKWRDKEKITFYDLEQPYRFGQERWRGTDPRLDLINICRYFFLLGWFDEDFWREFMSSSPGEANDITDTRDRSEIADWI